MKILFTILLAIFTPFLSFGAGGNNIEIPDKMDDFTPVIRFTVASDSHISAFSPQRLKRVQKTVLAGYAVAESSKTYNKLDACLFAGDITDNGYITEFALFKAAVDGVIRDETKLLGIVAKAHDSYHYDKKSTETIGYITDETSDFHQIINGFHFIGLSTSDSVDENHNDKQRVWLEKELSKAAADDPEKPVFVMHHEHVKNTVYGSSDFDGWGTDDFTDILNRYPQVIDLSGHSHYPINDPRSVWQGNFTAVGTGSLNYAEFTVDDIRCYHPEKYRKMAQCWIVEASADNEVRFTGFDLLSGSVICRYTIRNPADVNSRQYTLEQQKAKCSAPLLPENQEIRQSGNTLKICLDGAKSTDGYPVFLYRFIVTDEAGNEIENHWLLNRYWYEGSNEKMIYKISVKPGQTVSIYAENAYGMRSKPVVYLVSE